MSNDAHIDEPVDEGFPNPEISTAATGDVVYEWVMYNGEIYAFVVQGVRPAGDKLHTLLTARYWRSGQSPRETIFARKHWDMRSNSSTGAVIRELQRLYPSKAPKNNPEMKAVAWHKFLTVVHDQTELKAETLPEVVYLDDEVEDAVPSQHLLWPFIEYLSTNAIGAQGDSTKSVCALAICISVAEAYTLFPGCHMMDGRQRQSLYVDFEEMTPDKYRWRTKQLYAGVKMTPTKHMIHYLNMNGRLLTDTATEIDRYIKTHEIEFVVVDSASKAVGGETVEESNVISFFNAMATWRTTVLLIGHKAQEVPGTKIHKLSGNSQWRNQSRRYWEITAEAMGRDKNIVFEDHKGNNTTKSEPMAFRIQFDDDGWTFNTTSPEVVSGFKADWNSMIQTYLAENKAATVVQIVDDLSTTDRPLSRQVATNKLNAGLGRIYQQTNTAAGKLWDVIRWNEVKSETVENVEW